jgi:molybdopterin synthase catalytic subunit
MSEARISVSVQAEPFDVGPLMAQLRVAGVGGIANFTGIVRGGNGLRALEIEHHPRMTHAALERIAQDAATRWPLLALTIVHRFGRLDLAAPIVFVGASAMHRAAALDAVAFTIDRLKTAAPFWKREHFIDGTSRWVAPRAVDHASAARWG